MPLVLGTDERDEITFDFDDATIFLLYTLYQQIAAGL